MMIPRTVQNQVSRIEKVAVLDSVILILLDLASVPFRTTDNGQRTTDNGQGTRDDVL